MSDRLREAGEDLVIRPPEAGGPLDFAAIFGWPTGVRRPVELEVGCGKGRFLVGAAAAWPERDFVAVEQAGKLVRKVSVRAARAGLSNVRLWKGNAKDVLERLVLPASLARIHVYFPDPWPKRRQAKNRFFAGPMPELLARALEARGQVLLATDADPYFREVGVRLAEHGAFVRVLPDVFSDIPRGGFDAIFEGAGVPVFRGAWEKVAPEPPASP